MAQERLKTWEITDEFWSKVEPNIPAHPRAPGMPYRRRPGGGKKSRYGVDEFFAGALTLGARGFIGSTYNYAAKLYRQIWDDWEADRHEAVLSKMRIVCDGVRLLHQYGGLPCGKALMRLRNLNLGGVRPPLTALSEVRQQELLDRARLVFGESI